MGIEKTRKRGCDLKNLRGGREDDEKVGVGRRKKGAIRKSGDIERREEEVNVEVR